MDTTSPRHVLRRRGQPREAVYQFKGGAGRRANT